MNNEFNVLRTTFPGIQREGGQTIEYFNNCGAVVQPMTRSQWGKGKAPYSLAEPALWYWAWMGKGRPDTTRSGERDYMARAGD